MKRKMVLCCDVCGQRFDAISEEEQAIRHKFAHFGRTSLTLQMVLCCDVCNQQFDVEREDRATEHEAQHYNLTSCEYATWKKFSYEATMAKARVSWFPFKDDASEEALDRAIKELCEFEKQHNIDGTKRPSDFYQGI